ncbi:MAG: LCP family protein [Acidimicrobiia bacterium]|nr:LCP family protein [Acidimicrobiia bacterium]
MDETTVIDITEPPPVPQRKRRPFRFLFKLIIVLLVVTLGALYWGLAQIPHVEPEPDLASGFVTQTFLLIGSDSRADLPDGLAGSFGDFGGERADVIILARPSGGALQLLSLPRDLKVTVEGHGTNKINAAYAFGGAALLADTASAATGIPIHHVVEIDFAGFAALVDALGGIDIAFPNAARDTKSGLEVAAGTTHIDGATALAFSRSRSYQENINGKWVSVDADDIGRTGRQQQTLEAMLHRAASVQGVARMPLFLSKLGVSTRIDKGLGPIGVLTAAFGMWKADVDATTVPVRFSNEGGVSYVVFDGDKADDVIARFLTGEPLTAVD